MYIESKDKPSYCYLTVLAFNLILGCFTCGMVQAGDTDVVDIWAIKLNWGDDKDFYDTLISSSAVMGLTLGSVGSKFATDLGRRRAILISNAVITLMTIPYFFTCNFWIFFVTRFIMGLAACVIINATSLYISETMPNEWQSFMGCTINFGIVFGIFIVYLFGLLLPEKTEIQASLDDELWRVSYSLQLGNVFLTTILWLAWFRTEPIEFLVLRAENKGIESAAYMEAIKVIQKKH